MGYSANDKWVRVDIFKESGKWYTTIQLFWDKYNDKNEEIMASKLGESIHDIFRRCLQEQLHNRYKGMMAVCLEPWHEYSHPLMIRI